MVIWLARLIGVSGMRDAMTRAVPPLLMEEPATVDFADEAELESDMAACDLL